MDPAGPQGHTLQIQGADRVMFYRTKIGHRGRSGIGNFILGPPEPDVVMPYSDYWARHPEQRCVIRLVVQYMQLLRSAGLQLERQLKYLEA